MTDGLIIAILLFVFVVTLCVFFFRPLKPSKERNDSSSGSKIKNFDTLDTVIRLKDSENGIKDPFMFVLNIIGILLIMGLIGAAIIALIFI